MAETDSSTQFEQGRKCKECGEKIHDDAHKKRVFCSVYCRDRASWVAASRRKTEQRRIDALARNASKKCQVCGGDMPHDAPEHRKYCSDKCRWRSVPQEKKRAQAAARRDRIGDEEFKRRNAEGMRNLRKNNPDYAERQRRAKDVWRVNNPEKFAEERRRCNAYRSRHDAHVKHYKRHIRDMKRKHEAHVRSFYSWAKEQSAGWWMRHLKATGGDLWRNPKVSDAIKYRIHYRLSVEFRLKEVNRNTWRKEQLKARDDGSINFFALARERKTCVYCGIKMDDNMKCLDHIDPLSKGGENSINNVIVVCKSCNSKKAAKDFEVFVDELPEQRRRAAMMMYKRKKGRLPGQQPLVLEFN